MNNKKALLVSLLLATIFLIDYLLIVLTGIVANLFGATEHFFLSVYPSIMVGIVAASFALSALLFVKKRKPRQFVPLRKPAFGHNY